ncbi:MAG: type II toxin-antitoxin system VapC family toxin [Candidatus Bathyarchaeia archaeon]
MDASVAAKWALPGEPYQKSALKLKEDHILGLAELSAPSFIAQEVANALWRALKLGRIVKGDAEEALRALGEMRIELHELSWDQVAEGLDIASSLDLTIYDASYLYLSNRLRAPLVTADGTLYERSRKLFRITHVKDYS